MSDLGNPASPLAPVMNVAGFGLTGLLICVFSTGFWLVRGATPSSLVAFLAEATALDLFRLPVVARLGEGGALGTRQRLHILVLGGWLVVSSILLSFLSRQRIASATMARK